MGIFYLGSHLYIVLIGSLPQHVSWQGKHTRIVVAAMATVWYRKVILYAAITHAHKYHYKLSSQAVYNL